jgi:hypothetical protein
MTGTTDVRATQQQSAAGLWALRVLGAALLLAIAAIHIYLWLDGYRNIDVIGPAFLLQSVIAIGGALLVLIAPWRLLPVATLLGALFAIGSLGALLMTTFVGMFGFQESTSADWWWETVIVEVAAFVVLGLLTLVTARPALAARRRGR